MFLRRIPIWLAALCALGWSAKGDAFRHAWVEGGSGVCLPLLELSKHLDPAPVYRGALQFSYWESWRSDLSLSYTHLSGSGAPYTLHHVLGTAGLVWQADKAPIEAGGGISLFFARTDAIAVPGNWMLADNESEFGGWLRVGTPFALGWAHWEVHPWMEYQMALTRPRISRFVWAGANLRIPLW